MHKAYDRGDMVANIIAARARATEAQVEAGRAWYPAASKIVSAIADATHTADHRVAHALAALSPRNPWRWNVADAFAFAAASAEGRTMPKATTFNRNRDAAWRALKADGQPWLSSAPKVRNFVAAILGDMSAIVVDTWAVRVATDGSKDRVATDREYYAVAHAYRQAAEQLGESPTELQAITWLVARTEGTATLTRSNSHTYKAGTPMWLAALV